MTYVNVIIPYKNNINYLFSAFKSVFNQSHKNYKIFLVYDDENKSDLEKINKFLKKIKKIKKVKIIVNNKNLGAGESRNKAIRYLKSGLIAFLDSDDVWRKDKLKKQIKFMKNNNLKISHTSYNILNEKNLKVTKQKAPKKLFFKNLLKSCDIGLSTVVIDLKFFKKYNFKFASIKTKEDYVLWLNIIKRIKIIKSLNEYLTVYRKREKSLSSNQLINIKNGFLVYNKYMKYNMIKSLIYLSILSLNFIKKKIKNDFCFNYKL